MNALLRRLDPCAAWFRTLRVSKERVLWAFPAGLLGAYLVTVAFDRPVASFFALRDRRAAAAPLLGEARRLGLDHARVVADPAAAVGKPVAWCVDSPDGEFGFTEGRQTAPVRWTAKSDALRSFQGIHGYCLKVLAVVEGVDAGDVVRLRLVQKL